MALTFLFIVTAVLPTSSAVNSTQIDGIIADGEYQYNLSFDNGNFKIYFTTDKDVIYFGISAKTSGWVSIGIEPTSRMKDADIIAGWVNEDGNFQVKDYFSIGEFGPHSEDSDLGGTDDILEYAATEEGKVTTVEFKRYLSTNDTYDKPISSDKNIKIIWAMGNNDDFDLRHSTRGYGSLDFSQIEKPPNGTDLLWLYHAILMVMGFILMLIGATLAKFMKSKKWWLKAHRALGVVGSIISVLGFFMAFYMVSLSIGSHFQVFHAYLGLITIIMVLMTPVLGFMQFKLKNHRSQVRIAHRWFGRITITLMAFTIISGLLHMGII